MAHYSRLSKVVIDVPPAEHDRELAFWNAAVGEPLTQFTRHPEYHGAMLPGQDVGLLIQRLGAGQARVHIDIHTDDLPAEVARLEKLGAERAGQAGRVQEDAGGAGEGRHVHPCWPGEEVVSGVRSRGGTAPRPTGRRACGSRRGPSSPRTPAGRPP